MTTSRRRGWLVIEVYRAARSAWRVAGESCNVLGERHRRMEVGNLRMGVRTVKHEWGVISTLCVVTRNDQRYPRPQVANRRDYAYYHSERRRPDRTRSPTLSLGVTQ